MSIIEQIKLPITDEFARFEAEYRRVFSTENPLLRAVHEHILGGLGKRMRPILTLLSAKMTGLSLTPATIDAAIGFELLHIASLVHDDVVDTTLSRRGRASVNALWDNQISILTGDYILSNALSVAVRSGGAMVVSQIARLGKTLADGELLQLSRSHSSAMLSREEYEEIISKKTAVFFGTCALVGAQTVGAAADVAERLRAFGQTLGLCFQIRDDIFDYASTADEIGKPVGNDIREGKVTLPLLCAMERCSAAERARIEEGWHSHALAEHADEVVRFVRTHGGVEGAYERMQSLADEALALIADWGIPSVRQSLRLLVEHTLSRKN